MLLSGRVVRRSDYLGTTTVAIITTNVSAAIVTTSTTITIAVADIATTTGEARAHC